MTNAIIGRPRVTDLFGLSGGDWETDYPVTNLQLLPLSRVARSTSLDPADTTIIATSAAQRRVGLVSLTGKGPTSYNLSLQCELRCRLFHDAARADLAADMTIPAWPEVYPYDQLEWEDDNFWTGKYQAHEIADGSTWTRVFDFGSDYMTRAIEINITEDAVYNTDGYVHLGFMEIAARTELQRNFFWEPQFGFRFRTQEGEALGGSKYFGRKAKPRRFTGMVKFASHNEVGAKWWEMQRQLDKDGLVLWMPSPDDTVHLLRTSFLARLTDPGLFSITGASEGVFLDSVPIALEEVIG